MNFTDIYNDACCDRRIDNGVLDIKIAEHLFVLQEYLLKHGYSIDEVTEKTHQLFERGRFPERQAYNANGILVTFPTPEHKKKAIDKGTHFAENPKSSDGVDLYMPGDENTFAMTGIDTNISNNKEQDSISLEQDVENSNSDDSVDLRTKDEKQQDSEAVISILNGGNSNIENTMTEIFYTDRGGNYIDKFNNWKVERIYNENTKSFELCESVNENTQDDLKKKSNESNSHVIHSHNISATDFETLLAHNINALNSKEYSNKYKLKPVKNAREKEIEFLTKYKDYKVKELYNISNFNSFILNVKYLVNNTLEIKSKMPLSTFQDKLAPARIVVTPKGKKSTSTQLFLKRTQKEESSITFAKNASGAAFDIFQSYYQKYINPKKIPLDIDQFIFKLSNPISKIDDVEILEKINDFNTKLINSIQYDLTVAKNIYDSVINNPTYKNNKDVKIALVDIDNTFKTMFDLNGVEFEKKVNEFISLIEQPTSIAYFLRFINSVDLKKLLTGYIILNTETFGDESIESYPTGIFKVPSILILAIWLRNKYGIFRAISIGTSTDTTEGEQEDSEIQQDISETYNDINVVEGKTSTAPKGLKSDIKIDTPVENLLDWKNKTSKTDLILLSDGTNTGIDVIRASLKKDNARLFLLELSEFNRFFVYTANNVFKSSDFIDLKRVLDDITVAFNYTFNVICEFNYTKSDDNKPASKIIYNILNDCIDTTGIRNIITNEKSAGNQSIDEIQNIYSNINKYELELLEAIKNDTKLNPKKVKSDVQIKIKDAISRIIDTSRASLKNIYGNLNSTDISTLLAERLSFVTQAFTNNDFVSKFLEYVSTGIGKFQDSDTNPSVATHFLIWNDNPIGVKLINIRDHFAKVLKTDPNIKSSILKSISFVPRGYTSKGKSRGISLQANMSSHLKGLVDNLILEIQNIIYEVEEQINVETNKINEIFNSDINNSIFNIKEEDFSDSLVLENYITDKVKNVFIRIREKIKEYIEKIIKFINNLIFKSTEKLTAHINVIYDNLKEEATEQFNSGIIDFIKYCGYNISIDESELENLSISI